MASIVFAEALLLAGSGLYLLLHRKKARLDSILGLLQTLFAYNLFVRGLFWSGSISHTPRLFLSDVMAMTAFSPLVYFYVAGLVKPGAVRRKAGLLHFIPFFISICWYVVVHLVLKPRLDMPIHSYLDTEHAQLNVAIVSIVNLQMFSYALAAFMMLYAHVKKIQVHRGRATRVLLGFFILAVSCAFPLFASMQFELPVTQTVIAGFGLFAVLFAIFCYVRPGVTRDAFPDEKPPKKNPLIARPREAARILAELDKLIRCDRIYQDPDLTLQTLSNLVDTSVQNLSYVINDAKGMNFRSFINTCRIREAEHLLSDESEKNVLEVAYQVGFNSKSTFNAVFRSMTGLSPSEYRKKVCLPGPNS